MRTRRLVLATACAMATGALAAPPSAVTDTPFFANDQAATDALDREQAPYVAHARKTWPEARKRFLAGLPAPREFYVTTRIYDSAHRMEQVFVRVDTIQGTQVLGRLATTPVVVKTMAPESPIVVEEADIRDWTIVDGDGREEGNVVGNLMDRYAPAEESCGVIATDAKGQEKFTDLPGWTLSSLDPARPFALPAGAPAGHPVILCTRRSIVPMLADMRALEAGMPVSLRLADGSRASALEVVDGQLRLRMVKGEMSDVESSAAQIYLDAAQQAFDARANP